MEEEKKVLETEEEVTVNQEPKKKKVNDKTTLVVVIIIAVLIFALLAYRLFFENNESNNGKENTPTPTPTVEPTPVPEDEPEYAEWMTYLLNQNIDSIIVGDGETTKDLTIEDLREFLKEFNSHQYTLRKTYAGTGDSLNMQVTYTKDESNYTVRFMPMGTDFHVIWDSNFDNDFLEAIEKVDHESEEAQEGSGIIYVFTSLEGEISYSIFA